TPLNGSGKKCIMEMLKRIELSDVTVVKEQSEPDGNFPTCPYPNPEITEALQKGLDLCEEVKPDLLLATDPDCDRVGIAVNQNGNYVLMSGNEVGVLLLDFIARFKLEHNEMPANPVAVSTIVSTAMTAEVAKNYGIELRNVLTGFKYIGDVIAELEKDGHPERYLLGFEESYGYLKGGYVRDKDAVNASMLICEMASYFKKQGKTLIDVMSELYEKYGYYMNETLSFTFEGEDGMIKMKNILDDIRKNPAKEIISSKVVAFSDYQNSVCYANNEETVINLPKSNVLQFNLENGSRLIVRPSGTEPKIKLYLSAKGNTKEISMQLLEEMAIDGKKILGI
ncbi:MAG: phospho-sugar mutase, partial [Clostridia bacterium]